MAWTLDRNHAHFQFTVRHLMVTNVRGEFTDFDVNADFHPEDLAKSKVEVVVKTASINSRAADRDNHLRSADFFDVEKYPEMKFVSKNVVVTGNNSGRIVGDLTIRDVTKEVVLEVEYTGVTKTPWGGENAGFNLHTVINRKDWGLVWNVGLETGGVLVGDDVKIDIELELIKVVEQQPEAAQQA